MKLFMAPVAGFDILLYTAYTVTSVCGLVLVKWYLPGAIQAFQDGGLLRREIAVTGLGAALYITSFLVWLVILSRIQLSMDTGSSSASAYPRISAQRSLRTSAPVCTFHSPVPTLVPAMI